jgi:hypothetical protein
MVGFESELLFGFLSVETSLSIALFWHHQLDVVFVCELKELFCIVRFVCHSNFWIAVAKKKFCVPDIVCWKHTYFCSAKFLLPRIKSNA